MSSDFKYFSDRELKKQYKKSVKSAVRKRKAGYKYSAAELEVEASKAEAELSRRGLLDEAKTTGWRHKKVELFGKKR